jgi:hypothetical protein
MFTMIQNLSQLFNFTHTMITRRSLNANEKLIIL